MLLAQIVMEKELLYSSRKLVWDGQFAEAERMCAEARTSNPDSVVAAYVEGLACFSRCFYTGESAMYTDALEKLALVEDALKRTWGEAMGDIFTFSYFRSAVDWDHAVREALLAHALMLKAMVMFTTGSKFSGALAVRAAWKKFDALPSESHTADAAAADADASDSATAGAKEIVRSMFQFGCGTFLMLLSYAPPAITSILRVMGFNSDRERGTMLLDACMAEGGSFAEDAAFSMLLKCMVEHKREEDVAVLSRRSTLPPPPPPAATATAAAATAATAAVPLDPASWFGQAHAIADDLVARYPRGSCCWLKSHLLRIQGDIGDSLASMEGVERCATAAGLPRARQFRVLKEIAWCQFIDMRWADVLTTLAGVGEAEGHLMRAWARTLSGAAARALSSPDEGDGGGEDGEARALLASVASASSGNDFDGDLGALGAVLATRVSPQLPAFEVLYLLSQIRASLGVAFLQRVLGALEAIAATPAGSGGDDAVTAEERAVLLLLRGSTHRNLEQHDAAEPLLRAGLTTLAISNSGSWSSKAPSSSKAAWCVSALFYELALIEVARGDTVKAKSLVKVASSRASKVPFESNLKFRFKALLEALDVTPVEEVEEEEE